MKAVYDIGLRRDGPDFYTIVEVPSSPYSEQRALAIAQDRFYVAYGTNGRCFSLRLAYIGRES